MKNLAAKMNTPYYIMAFAGFFIMGGYEFIRSSSNALLKEAYGFEIYPIIWGSLPFLLPFILYLYGKSITKVGPRDTLLRTLGISGFLIFVSYVFIKLKFAAATIALMVVREAYIIIVIEQLWSFINVVSPKDEIRFIYGRVLAISAVGAIIGDIVVYYLAPKIGAANVVAISLVCFIASFILVKKAYLSSKVHDKEFSSLSNHKKDPLGLGFFKTNPILGFLFIIVLLSQAYGTIIALNYESMLYREISDVDKQTAYAATVFGVLHGGSLFMQIFLIPYILKVFGARVVHLVVPVIHLCLCISLIYYPSLETATLSFLMFKLVDYSLFKVAKESLYFPLPLDVKFRTKEVIDVFAYRFGKGITSLSVSFAQTFGFIIISLSSGIIGSALVAVWMIVSSRLSIYLGEEQKSSSKVAAESN